jgi:tetratricopeptide (TPR) repeat protein
VVALWSSGCGDSDRFSYANETDEPYYREGVALEKTGRRQEALSAFLKVIEKRGDDAPESHLEAGLLYQQHINDPLSAIYHFKKYLTIRPNSPQASLVRQRIDSAVREFARTLPAQPIENQFQRVDLIAAMDKMKLENDLLKQQIADLRAGRDVPEAATDGAAQPAAGETNLAVSFDNIPTVRTHPARTEPPSASAPAIRHPAAPVASRAATNGPAQPPPAAPARGTPRKHAVVKGDTLSNLAQRYYNNRARWHDIYAANRGVMKNDGDLRVGMELVIP